MLKTGLANIGLGIVIALVGAVVTAVSYSMVSGGGGTYFVAYGAIVVGAWRVLLGLFQVLRGAFSGLERPAPASTSAPQRVDAPSVSQTSIITQARDTSSPRDASNILPIVGGLLVAEAGLRLVSLGLLLGRVRVDVLMDNVMFALTAVVVPAGLVIGGIAAGVALLRRRSAAVAFAAGLCVAGLLFQAYGLVGLLEALSFRVPWTAWAFFAAHLAVYVVSLIMLLRPSSGHNVAASPPAGQTIA